MGNPHTRSNSSQQRPHITNFLHCSDYSRSTPMSRLEKQAEEPIQPMEKELMLDNPDEGEKWGPSQEGRVEYKPSLNEIEKLKEEGRLGLQSDKKYLAAVKKAGRDVEKEFDPSGQVHIPVEGQTYEVKPRQRHNP